jgi:hypothetical protein
MGSWRVGGGDSVCVPRLGEDGHDPFALVRGVDCGCYVTRWRLGPLVILSRLVSRALSTPRRDSLRCQANRQFVLGWAGPEETARQALGPTTRGLESAIRREIGKPQ